MKQLILEDQIVKKGKKGECSRGNPRPLCKFFAEPLQRICRAASAKFVAEAASATNLQRRPLHNGHEAEARAASAPINRNERRRERVVNK